MPELVPIFWSRYDYILDTPQISNIQCAMMRWTVFTGNTSPVHTKYDWKVLNGNIVYNLIICPLKECGINCYNGAYLFSCQSCSKCYRMGFCNSYIKKPVWKLWNNSLILSLLSLQRLYKWNLPYFVQFHRTIFQTHPEKQVQMVLQLLFQFYRVFYHWV